MRKPPVRRLFAASDHQAAAAASRWQLLQMGSGMAAAAERHVDSSPPKPNPSEAHGATLSFMESPRRRPAGWKRREQPATDHGRCTLGGQGVRLRFRNAAPTPDGITSSAPPFRGDADGSDMFTHTLCAGRRKCSSSDCSERAIRLGARWQAETRANHVRSTSLHQPLLADRFLTQ